MQWVCDARYIEHHNQAKKGLLDRTGQWLIDRPEFRNWQNSSASGILWLRGMRKWSSRPSLYGTDSLYSGCSEDETHVQDPHSRDVALS